MAGELFIGDHNWRQFVEAPLVGGERKARGLVPRDYRTHPPCYSPNARAFDMPLIDRSLWSEWLKGMESSKSCLSHLRGDIPSRDQNGRGYCWAHSTVSAMMLLRARDGQPLADLSAYCIACIIKDYADEGGWGALSLDWAVENGCPTSQFWPQQGASRKYDTPEMRANAKLHRVTETWMESAAPYDRNLTFEQMATCLLCRIPVVVDFNWWSHSVCAADLVETRADDLRNESGKRIRGKAFLSIMDATGHGDSSFGIRIWNSWGDSWSDRGMGVLQGSRAVPDGACAPRVTAASVV